MPVFPSAPPADLRLGQPWTPLQRAKNDVLWALASLALAVTRPLPLPVLRVLGRLLGVAAYSLAPSVRRTALANVRRVFPELGDREGRAFVGLCFATLGELLGETAALLHTARPLDPLPIWGPSRGLLEQALREGRGVVFASAHLGPWERVAASLVAAGVPLVTLARESYDPRLSHIYDRLRSPHGVRVVWRSTPGAAGRIVRTLRAGGVLGVPMDLRARVASCSAPFLGHDAPTAVGPARIALRTGAAVIVGTVAPRPRSSSALEERGAAPRCVGKAGNVYGGRRWMGSSLPSDRMTITATRIMTADLPRDGIGVQELTCRINTELSHRILALPHAWVWMHERWGS